MLNLLQRVLGNTIICLDSVENQTTALRLKLSVLIINNYSYCDIYFIRILSVQKFTFNQRYIVAYKNEFEC